ncbi:MAG: biopolymer transporter Tol [Candidatus Methylacidiphilales bacterium]
MIRTIFTLGVGAILICAGVESSKAQAPVIKVEAGESVSVAIQSSGELAGILKNNFMIHGAINVVEANRADFIIAAAAGSGGVEGSVKSATGATRLTRMTMGDLRKAAHEFTDAVIQELTGRPGIATSQVVFVSNQSGHKEIYLMDMDGERVRQITRDQSISLGPKFSPDGGRIAFTSYKSGHPDVWVIDLARSTKKAVAFFPGVNSGASFSPDGSRLALTLSKDGNTDLYTMPAGGGDPVRLVRTRGTEASPVWSPNGQQILFVSDDRGAPQLFIIPATGGSMERLQTFSSYTTEPTWSPDGTKVAYSLMTAGQSQIGMTDLRTKEQTVLTAGGSHESPSWARDSRHLVYSKGGQLFLCDTLTKKTSRLTSRISGCTEPNVSL